MRSILEQYLDLLEVRYTHAFASRLYREHPHRNNMFGLKRMLDVYGIEAVGLHTDYDGLLSLTLPCILHLQGDFVICTSCDEKSITYLSRGKEYVVGRLEFEKKWSGDVLVVAEVIDASEPDFYKNRWNDAVDRIKRFVMPVILCIAVITGIAANHSEMSPYLIVAVLSDALGAVVCLFLIQKHLSGASMIVDKVCSQFQHSDCNDVLESTASRVVGISWSEIGLGYFSASLLMLSLWPESVWVVMVMNCIAMCYGVWSVYYQRRIARSWCPLCLIVQGMIWISGIALIVNCGPLYILPDFLVVFYVSLAYGLCIMIVHTYVTSISAELGRSEELRRYRELKANPLVAKALIQNGAFYQTTSDDSSILFGDPDAKLNIVILSNPHCNPCARMHRKVERILDRCAKGINVRYILTSFGAKYEDSVKYLISRYQMSDEKASRKIFSDWFEHDKYRYKQILNSHKSEFDTPAVLSELEAHSRWRGRTEIAATPTVLVNGYVLPPEYELEDIIMIAELAS